MIRGQCLIQHVEHLWHVVRVVNLAHPVDTNAFDGFGNRVFGGFGPIVRPRRQDILPARGGGVVVVDHDDHAIGFVVDRVAKRRTEAVVPEPAIADYRNRSLFAATIERAIRGRTQAIAHG